MLGLGTGVGVANGPAVTTVAQDGVHPAGLRMPTPEAIARDPRDGSIVVTDWTWDQVLRISADGTSTSVVAGTGQHGNGGDGGDPRAAQLGSPTGLAFLADGSLLVADSANNRIRRISADGTRITAFAGTGSNGSPYGANGDGASAASAKLDQPLDIQPLADGRVVVADSGHNRLRVVGTDGKISALAGNGVDYELDGTGAAAAFRLPRGLALRANGHVLVVDRFGQTVRDVDPATGATTTVAGVPDRTTPPSSANPGPDFGGDDGPATAARLSPLSAVATDDGGFLIVDTGNHRIRRVTPDGAITTLMGTGTAGRGADGQAPAASALNLPADAVIEPSGALVVDDFGNQRIVRATVDLRAPALATPAPAPAPAVPDGTRQTTPGPTAPAPVPTPSATVVVGQVSGTVTVQLPGTSKAVPLASVRSIPLGTIVDARAGHVALTASTDRKGHTSQGRFWAGRFRVAQVGRTHPTTVLTLTGGDFSSCTSGQAHASAAKKRPGRRLWGSDHHGRFSTTGRGSVATVRGTRWMTSDSCRGTTVKVLSGAVSVKPTRGGPPHLVTAGHARFDAAP